MGKTINKNNISKLYLQFDDAMVRYANRAVRAWNWTTGRTRADLANGIAITSVFAWSTLAYMDNGIHTSGSVLGLPVVTFMVVKQNLKIDNAEREAIEKEAKSFYVEDSKETFRKWSFPAASCYGILGFVTSKFNGFGDSCFATATMIGLQGYIMRADYIQPRKNALARGIDNVKEMLRRPMLQPVPVPVPVDKFLRK